MVSKLIDLKNKPHAILLIESKMCNLKGFVNQYVKAIIGDNSINKHLYKSVDDGTYLDMIQLNGYDANISKENILNLISQFSKTSIEIANKQIYLIRGIEHSSPQAINALLKFLEEPPQNVYGILTTRAINLVLQTIKSRCQSYILKSDSKYFENKIQHLKLSNTQINVIKKIYYDVDDVISDLQSEKFQKVFEFANQFIKKHKDLSKIKILQEEFIKMDYRTINLVLKVVNILLGNNEHMLQLIDNIHLNPTKILLFNKIWTILEEIL